MNVLKHLKTIITHKYWVFYYACKIGIPWQGFWHDMSKFSLTEFLESIKYYTGTSSPIDACKKANGYSIAWLHHKGRNAHHYEYWQDNFDKGGQPLKMPAKYVREMFCDYLAAGRTYSGPSFNFIQEHTWWMNKRKNPMAMHKDQIYFFDCMFAYLCGTFSTRPVDSLTKQDWKFIRTSVDRMLDT